MKFNPSYIALLLAATFLLYFAYLSFIPLHPITISNIPFPVSKTTVKVGDTLTYTVKYCRNIPEISTVTRQLDGTGPIFIDQTFRATPEGCGTAVGSVIIPNTPAGTYRIEITSTIDINPIRHFTINSYTEPFMVTN